jgi:hypothetical protein
MRGAVANLFYAFFPLPDFRTAENYRTKSSEDPRYGEIFRSLQTATRGASVEQQKHFCDYAQGYIAEQRDLTSSIISRAQGLLVAQTFLGALLALVTALMGHSEIIDGWRIYVLFVLLGYTIIQLVLLTMNALRATAGFSYPAPGVSPLIEWIPQREELLLKNMGLEFIKSYWGANIANTWRVNHLGLAQNCLRNIVFALALLVFILIAVVFFSNIWSKSSQPSTPQSIPSEMMPG